IELVSEALVDHKLYIEVLQKKSGTPQKSNIVQTENQQINYLEKIVKQLVSTVNKHNQHIKDLEQENKDLKRKSNDL
ncbi:11261_t:CDS:1, partial [Racocetra persica]